MSRDKMHFRQTGGPHQSGPAGYSSIQSGKPSVRELAVAWVDFLRNHPEITRFTSYHSPQTAKLAWGSTTDFIIICAGNFLKPEPEHLYSGVFVLIHQFTKEICHS